MADINLIHEFAVKWRNKFTNRNINYIGPADHSMADDCAALGFVMDCGSAFSEKYGNAASNSGALNKIIGEVDEVLLLGSAIYSRLSHFDQGACSDAEIMEPQNRDWFIIALTRLEELSSPDTNGECTVILFPGFLELEKEIKKLRTEISMLLLERDELRLVVCKNIETAYMLALGGLEYKAFELNCSVLRLKRKIDLIQAKKNRQEKVEISLIEKILDKEFVQFQQQLDEQINKINKALEYSSRETLSDEETKEIKKLYRNIVKALHPDLHPDVTPAQLQLFQNAVQAYENGDLNSLRIIAEMVTEPVIPEQTEDGMALLVKDKERLAKCLEQIRNEITIIKSEYPYTLKALVEDPEKIAEKRAELEQTIVELKEAYDYYAARLEEMLR